MYFSSSGVFYVCIVHRLWNVDIMAVWPNAQYFHLPFLKYNLESCHLRFREYQKSSIYCMLFAYCILCKHCKLQTSGFAILDPVYFHGMFDVGCLTVCSLYIVHAKIKLHSHLDNCEHTHKRTDCKWHSLYFLLLLISFGLGFQISDFREFPYL